MTDDLEQRMARARERASALYDKHKQDEAARDEERASREAARTRRLELWKESTVPAIRDASGWVETNLADVGYKVAFHPLGDPARVGVRFDQDGNQKSLLITFMLTENGVVAEIVQKTGGRDVNRRSEDLPDAGEISVDRVKSLFMDVIG